MWLLFYAAECYIFFPFRPKKIWARRVFYDLANFTFLLSLFPIKYGFSTLTFINIGYSRILCFTFVLFFAHAMRILTTYAKENSDARNLFPFFFFLFLIWRQVFYGMLDQMSPMSFIQIMTVIFNSTHIFQQVPLNYLNDLLFNFNTYSNIIKNINYTHIWVINK